MSCSRHPPTSTLPSPPPTLSKPSVRWFGSPDEIPPLGSPGHSGTTVMAKAKQQGVGYTSKTWTTPYIDMRGTTQVECSDPPTPS
jgi:hypothetical protein